MTDDGIVAALAEALPCHAGCSRDPEWHDEFHCDCGRWEEIHALLPVVRRVAEQRAAEKPDVMPFPAYGCDWGHCDNDSPFLRWADDLGAYLPVCERHAQDRLSVARAAALTATPNHRRNAT